MVRVGQVGGAAGRRRAGRRLVQRVVEIARSDNRAPGSSRRPGCARTRTARRAPSAARPPSPARQLDRREKRRRIGETGALDQEPAHLDLRMRSGLQSAIDLEHGVFLEQQGAVRLLGAEPAHHQPLRHRRVCEQRRLPEADLAGCRRRRCAPAAWPGAAPHRPGPARNRPATMRRPARLRGGTGAIRRASRAAGVCRASLPAGDHTQASGRKYRWCSPPPPAPPRPAAAGSCRDACHRSRPARRGKLGVGRHPRRSQPLVLGGEPALPRQEAGITSRSSCGRLCRPNKSPQPCGMTSVTNSGPDAGDQALTPASSGGAASSNQKKLCPCRVSR